MTGDCHSDRCITCSDEGVAMQVLRVDDRRSLALCVDDAGDKRTVEIELVLPIAPGDELLVHAGTALVRLG